MSAAAPLPAARTHTTSEPSFSPPAARGIAFTLLVAFGALHWMAMLEPTAYGRAWDAVLISVGTIVLLLAARRLPPRARTAAAVATGVVATGFALLAGGVADELLRPDRWGELASGISRGLSALPGARVPYRGLDQWTRVVLGCGGTAIAVLAALLAFWPRRHALGFRHVGLIVLVTLYAIPAVALDFQGEFLRGAVLVVLVLAYLRLETLQIGDAGAAGALALAVALLGLIAAPALDRGSPWFDYESWALDTADAKTTTFTWDHTYGTLTWPRDGRELLRVKAQQPAYWKAVNLDQFDGLHWVSGRGTPDADGCDVFGYPGAGARSRWIQTISVSVRNLRTPTFITAGSACAIDDPRVSKLPLGDGTYATISRPLHRGDAYRALVYTPTPTERQRRDAGTVYPLDMERFTRITLPSPGPEPNSMEERSATDVQFPLWGSAGAATATPRNHPNEPPSLAAPALRASPYGRAYRLARTLAHGARTQEEFIERVEHYLASGFSYTETPPPAATNLEGFLFTARTGYCQQFSGAMALLLRMGGVPARVASGFASGSFDRSTGEYVVRDLDAHSWVEAWFPGYGWVTFDPTPAASPARSSADAAAAAALRGGRAAGAPDLGGDIRSDPSRQAAVGGGGISPWAIAGLVLLAALAAGLLAAAVVRHQRRSAAGWGLLAELEQALRRTRRAPAPGTTLNGLERALAAAPGAAGYVRALREQRYGGGAGRPTAAQRRALRSELGRGGGLVGRARAWWALPPRRLH